MCLGSNGCSTDYIHIESLLAQGFLIEVINGCIFLYLHKLLPLYHRAPEDCDTVDCAPFYNQLYFGIPEVGGKTTSVFSAAWMKAISDTFSQIEHTCPIYRNNIDHWKLFLYMRNMFTSKNDECCCQGIS